MQALTARGLGAKISLGGGLGLLFYLDYRPTHDVDAWWSSDATGEERRQVVALLEETLGSFGAVETHLARIEQHRRLDQIAQPEQRGEAERVRAWFGQELLNAVE